MVRVAPGPVVPKTALAAMALLTRAVVAADILRTVGFTSCSSSNDIVVQKADISYDNGDKTVTFDVAGTSSVVQNVTAVLNVTAYGVQVYSKSFNPCEAGTYVERLCPVPSGYFTAIGSQGIADDLVPSIAFEVPDIAAVATLELTSRETGDEVACIRAQISNGKTADIPAVSYVAAGIAGAALVLSGISSAGAAFGGGHAGPGTVSPSFTEVFGWFQGMAMNGMLSVKYPQVYRSFSKNFAFSTGLVPWDQMQMSIDNFRKATGGNLTNNSVEFMRNATLAFADGSVQTRRDEGSSAMLARSLGRLGSLAARTVNASSDGIDDGGGGGGGGNGTAPSVAGVQLSVSGIKAFAEQLSIPSANTFMTVLLIVAVVIAGIVVGILLLKLSLEFWTHFGDLPKSLAGFRKHYRNSIARTVTALILLLYGVWVLYCIFQFTEGDSWAAKLLAGLTLALFTAVLAFFTWRIWSTARRLKDAKGDAGGLYDDKDIWVRYSLFYESYRKDCWWLFVPAILYMFARGCILAAADGHGLVQTAAQLVVEAAMLGLLLWSKPYERRSGNVLNISIQVVRVLSVVCILLFVEQFGIAETTQTVAGVALIVVQSALTGILAILIVWNAVVALVKENPHRKRRKEMEKMQSNRDTLTSLDARPSLFMERTKTELDKNSGNGNGNTAESFAFTKIGTPGEHAPAYARPPPSPTDSFYTLTPATTADQGRDSLMANAAPVGQSDAARPVWGGARGGYPPGDHTVLPGKGWL